MNSFYKSFASSVASQRSQLGRPMRYCEKIIASHGGNLSTHNNSFVKVMPDRIALQDASAQMALLQFMSIGKDKVEVPSTVHCDHLIVANSGEDGARGDLTTSIKDNKEVFDFLHSASQRYGLGFWKPGSGIIHQIVLENYAFPGGMMIGTDSHTPNAGGLGMMAIGVGGADAVDVMAGRPFEFPVPKVLGVNLSGTMGEWTSAKDVILELSGRLSVNGGTGFIIEYFGDGVSSLSATDMATICNMGAEVGATTSLFPYTESMGSYLKATGRYIIPDDVASLLIADENAKYDYVEEINLSELVPKINGPHSPDLEHKVGKDIGIAAKENGWPLDISAALIGSCTNSSYYDMTTAASLVKQATKSGIKPQVKEFLVTPGSELIRETLERDGILDIFREAGATILSNACGPCIGQWKRDKYIKDKPNTIVNSFNRNFLGRNDGSRHTHAFVTSPITTVALAYAGRLDFDPSTDTISNLDDKEGFRFFPPRGEQLPSRGFGINKVGNDVYVPPPEQSSNDFKVEISPTSNRLQKIGRFDPWDGNTELKLTVLLKVAGKCTTDHISPAGSWLKYKGHLENISECTLINAANADEEGKINHVVNPLNQQVQTVPEVARSLKNSGRLWVIVAEDNYGEGSAREHAALQPRYLGCRAVVAKSFARIHQKNLTRVGILPLTFSKSKDYDLVRGGGELVIHSVDALQPGKPLVATFEGKDIILEHKLSEEHIKWFKAGGALNCL